MTVARQLDAIGKTPGEIVHENHGGVAISGADIEGRNELTVGVQADPRPNVTRALRSALRRRNVLLLGIAKGPRLIDLYALARKVDEHPVLIVRECLPSVLQELLKGGSADAGQAGNCAKGDALRHHLEDLRALLGGELVHGHDNAQSWPIGQA